MSNMTAMEAINVLQNWQDAYDCDLSEAAEIAISSLQASIPHVLTLAEARALEPHTAVFVEYEGSNHPELFIVGRILPSCEWPQYGRNVRWWTAWPDEGLRNATGWKEDAL